MKTIIRDIFFIICVIYLTVHFTKEYYDYDMRNQFLRGIEVGGDYWSQYGEFPSYWHWNKKFDDKDFNMDIMPPNKKYTLVVDTILRGDTTWAYHYYYHTH